MSLKTGLLLVEFRQFFGNMPATFDRWKFNWYVPKESIKIKIKTLASLVKLNVKAQRAFSILEKLKTFQTKIQYLIFSL